MSTDNLRIQTRQAVASQKRTVTVLSSLLAAQDKLGYLPNEAIEEVAAFTKTSMNEVWGVATFYKNFRFSPPTKHSIEVCWGPTCHILGAPRILQKVQETLGLSGEGDTPDRNLKLRYNTCLGACSQAPVISINHHLQGNLTEEKAQQMVTKIVNRKS